MDFDDAIAKHASQTSISLINQYILGNYEFSFSPISVQLTSKYISLLKSNKAVGHDGLHAAFLKCSGAKTSLCNVFKANTFSRTFLVFLNGLVSIPYTIRKMICAKKIIGLLMIWWPSIRYLKEFHPIS